MDIGELVKQLVDVDYPDEWSAMTKDCRKEDRAAVFKEAEPVWLERMAAEGKLLMHPDALSDLAKAGWRPTDLHRRMIWASVLASLEGADSKVRFNSIKARLRRKHGNEWWFDVYKRLKATYGARMWLRRQREENGDAVNFLASRTVLVAAAVQDQVDRALRSIPSS